MAVPLLGPKARFADLNFNPLSGGLLYSYVAGTTTPLATYTDASGTVPNANPVVLDSAGYANIWLGTGTYKFILTDSLGVQQWSQDNYPGNVSAAFGGTVLPVSTNTNITSAYANSVIIASGTISLNLPPAATAGQGFIFSVYNNGTGVVTIDPSASETINGALTLTLQPGESVMVDCSGTAWFGLFKKSIAPVTSKTATYTVGAGDQGSLIEVNASTATKDLIINLPAVATVANGFTVTIKKMDADTTLSATLASNAMASTNATTTVTVTDTAPFIANLSVGDVVTFTGATTFGGIPATELNGPKFILSIPTSTTYTFASSTAASSTTTGGGAAINRSAVINNTVTIDGNGAETIDGSTTYVLNSQYQTVTVVSNGTSWDVAVPKSASFAGQLNYNNLFLVQDQKTSGTGGGTSSNTTTTQRNLNTMVVNNIPGSSLINNQVTLPAGTYFIEGSAPAYSSNTHKCRLYNVTDAAYAIEGTSEQVTNAQQVQSNSLLSGVVTIASSKVFELRHYTSVGQATIGFGVSVGQGTEIYSTLKIWKVI